ncbi:MAG: primosomal protein N' [Oscillospiraceae bacterium]|nr:primosomal protein N' [Oscillospiraceae bacterium]
MSAKYAKIAVSELTYWLDRPYDYLIPSEHRETLRPGMRVYVPFSRGNRRAEGIVLSVSNSADYESPKAIISVLDEQPVLTDAQLKLAFWMRERFFCTVYEAVRAILPAGLWFSGDGKRKASDKMVEHVRLAVSAEEAYELAHQKARKAPQQASVLSLLSAVYEGETAEIRTLTGASRQSIKTLVDAGVLEFFHRESFRRPSFRKGEKRELPELDADQQKAYEGLCALASQEKLNAALLFGVTGSGKTSVYIKLISRVLESGSSVILLVPEIALTPQMLETFSSYFGDNIAVLHSSLSVAERYDEWKRVKRGEAKLVIGTRSAVFAPAENLGLIIIDEEQEDTYKSESAPRYHARDVAMYRCSCDKALLLLGSATPDVCSMYAADSGVYSYFTLPKRYNRMALPEVSIVDMKRELRRGNDSCISSFLRDELQKNIENGEQSILFINRRGTSKLITCGDCGYIYKCPHCSVSLTYHAGIKRLQCHYCGWSQRVATVCPDCGGELRFTGDGTERIEQQLAELFPGTETLRVDTDTVTEAGSHDALLSRFREEHIPIMIGTQMVTKGLNFEDVTLVGVLSADQSLYCGDYRAAERTFSLITQVVGRSGRASRPGRAVIQTFTPDNQVIRFAAEQNYEGFFREEIDLRRVQKCPPFTQMISLTVTGNDESMVLRCCNEIKKLLGHALGSRLNTDILGPAPYPVVKVAGKYRYKLILRCKPDREVRAAVSKILVYSNTQKEFRGVSVYADMNPLN